jgi:hypothetical protein
MAHQHEEHTPVDAGLFDGFQISRSFDNAKNFQVATGRGTDVAQLLLAEGVASLTPDNFGQRLVQRIGNGTGAVPIPFEQVKSHPLRRLGPDSRQTPQGLPQRFYGL